MEYFLFLGQNYDDFLVELNDKSFLKLNVLNKSSVKKKKILKISINVKITYKLSIVYLET